MRAENALSITVFRANPISINIYEFRSLFFVVFIIILLWPVTVANLAGLRHSSQTISRSCNASWQDHGAFYSDTLHCDLSYKWNRKS